MTKLLDLHPDKPFAQGFACKCFNGSRHHGEAFEGAEALERLTLASQLVKAVEEALERRAGDLRLADPFFDLEWVLGREPSAEAAAAAAPPPAAVAAATTAAAAEAAAAVVAAATAMNGMGTG